jgi:MscS family membrane protein
MMNSIAMHVPIKTAVIIFMFSIMACCLSVNVYAQKNPLVSPSKETTAPAQQETALDDPLGRSTPQGTLLGFMKDVDREDYERAAEYLDTKQPPKRAQQLAHQLQTILDQGLSGHLPKLSNKPEGDLQDGLKPNRERIGVAKTSTGTYDIFLERIQRGEEPPVWLFSSMTLKLVPEIYMELGYERVAQYVPKLLQDYKLFKYPAWRLIGILIVIPLSFFLAWFVTWVLLVCVRFMFRRSTAAQTKQRIILLKGPIRILALSLGFFVASLFSYSLLSRLFWLRVAETLAIVGLSWLSLRLVDPIVEKLWKRKHLAVSSGNVAMERLLHKIIKALVIIVGALFISYMAGINLTAVLTGLGIGGLAVAFAAQKTLENLFGGVMIISDRPIRVGDFCRAGDYQGTVEDIGLRSTRLRTLGRTLVSVPNGQLATMSLENFTVRDKILFRHNIQLRYETSADQLRFVISEIRRLLYEHPKVETASARVRFTGLKDSALELEVYAYILETDYAVFLAIQEDLLLRLMSLVEESGTSFAFPSRTTYIVRDAGLDKAKSKDAMERVSTWREQGVLPFPDFMPDDIAEFENKLDYPQKGSVSQKKLKFSQRTALTDRES